jgi:hypothetical protein
VESSVVEQADAGAGALGVGAGAAGADGEGEGIARTCDDDAWARGKWIDGEFACGACDACGVSHEDGHGAEARKHEPLERLAQYFCNEEGSGGTCDAHVTQR